MPNESCYGYDQPVGYFYNYSGKSIITVWRKLDYVVLGLGLPVCLIIILANVMVMTAIIINQRFHFPIYYLLGNMAAADLFAGVSYLNLMLNTGPWTIKLSIKQWFARRALIDMSLTASVVNLLAVAIERHQSIFTMQLHSTMSNRRVVMLIVGIWLTAILMGLMPTMGWNCVCDPSVCSETAPLYSRSYHIFQATVNLLIFSIMVAMYSRIFMYVRHQSAQISLHTSKIQQETVLNLMKTVFLILGAFVICWTPGLLILLLDGLNCRTCNVLQFEKYCLVLAECNSLMNPIIYTCRDEEMRHTFMRMLCRVCRKTGYQQGEPLRVHCDTSRAEVLLEGNCRNSNRLDSPPGRRYIARSKQ